VIRRLLRLDPPPGYVVRYDPRFGWEAFRLEHGERLACVKAACDLRAIATWACHDDLEKA